MMRVFAAIVWTLLFFLFGLCALLKPEKTLHYRGVFRKPPGNGGKSCTKGDLVVTRMAGLFAIFLSVLLAYLLLTGEIG